MEQKITIDDDYSVVRRPRTFKVNGKTVGEFKFNNSSASDGRCVSFEYGGRVYYGR